MNEVKELFANADDAENVVFDLEETKLVDREAVTFLTTCQAQGAKLRNCPAYIEEWIARENVGLGLGTATSTKEFYEIGSSGRYCTGVAAGVLN